MKGKKLFVIMTALTILMAPVTIWGAGGRQGSAADDGLLPISMSVRLFDEVPDMNNPYWTYFQQKAGVKLDVEWIPEADYLTRLNLILSSQAMREVLIANPSREYNSPPFINAVQNNAFWDLTPLLGDFSRYPNLRDNSAPDAWRTSRVLGRIYGVPQNVPQVSPGPMIRKDLVDKAGLQMPSTLDELLDVVEAIVRQNPNIVGIVSLQDMISQSDGGLGAAYGTTEPFFNSEGGLIFEKLTPAHVKLIDYLRRAYSRNVISREFAVMRLNQAMELFTAGSAVVLLNQSARWVYAYNEMLRDRGISDAEVVILPALEGDRGFYSVPLSSGVVDLMCISKRVPEAKVLQILDYFDRTTTMEYYDLTTYGIEGTHFTRDANGFRIATPQRNRDMGSSAPWQVVPLAYYPFMRVDSTAAPESFNIAHRSYVEEVGYLTRGRMNPFGLLTSAAWAQVWPRYSQDWLSRAVQAVMGQISMADYSAYLDTLNNNPEMRTAYQEFAREYRAIFN